MAELQFSRAVTAFLYYQLAQILPNINASCAAEVVGNAAAPVFELAIGEVPNPAGPKLAIKFISAPMQRIADREVMATVNMQILCLIPRSADDTGQNFEMARQVAADHVNTLLLTDTIMLVPELFLDGPTNAASDAFDTDIGYPDDIFGYKAADGKTVVQGWRIPWRCRISVETR